MICAVCGRNLRTDKSKALGYGPVCYKKMFGNEKIKIDNTVSFVSSAHKSEPIPGQILLNDFIVSETEK